uniref:Uncharacterized protein n=1 Tax=Arundo donax TaxID=35708 RepID=A0A0A9AF88_ARUDO
MGIACVPFKWKMRHSAHEFGSCGRPAGAIDFATIRSWAR